MDRPPRIEPGPGQESVWDYPRPPRVEETSAIVQVVCEGIVVARTTRALRVLQTGHPPTYYIPRSDILPEALQPSAHRPTVCEFKGVAVYFNVAVGETVERDAAWSYPRPSRGYEAITDHVAFYADRVDQCTVDGEAARAQPGGFLGGWITSKIVGPFKSGPHTYAH